MADTPVPATPEDPFDLGDTSLTFPEAKPASSSVPPASEASTSPARVLPPRASDGTFVKPPETPKHPAHLLNQANELGMDPETIAETSTPTLYRMVNLLLLREREVARSFATQQSLEGTRVKQPDPAQPVQPEVDEIDALLAEGIIEPRILQQIKKLKGTADEVKALKTALQERDQREALKDFNSSVQLVDAAFAKLGNPLLGEGAGIELAKDPAKKAEFARRVALLNAAGITDLRQVNRLTIMKQLREANELLFGATSNTPANPYDAALAGKPPRISEEQWANGGVAHPSQRNGAPELKGEALAIKNLTEKLRDMDARATDAAELEGIPD